MRKFLIMILIVILLVALGFMAIKGLEIGKFKIHSIQDIIADNKELDEELATLSYSIDNDYETSKTNLQKSLQTLLKNKQDYQDAITFSTEDEIQKANQSEKYKLDYLWTKIGLYATKNGVVLQMNVSNSSSGLPSQYDISFTAIGEYLSISEFIYAIENDSNLGFKIERFSLQNYSGTKTDEDGNTVSDNLLRGSFVVRNVPLDQESLTTIQTTGTSSMTNQSTSQSSQSSADQSIDQSQTDSTGTNQDQSGTEG